MKLLLDSHVFLWWQAADPRLSASTIGAIQNAAVVYVSAATAWELGLKVSLGKLSLPGEIEPAVSAAGFSQLPVQFAHAAEATRLPLHHRDPFDRLLIAQARAEGLVLVSADGVFGEYEVALLRA